MAVIFFAEQSQEFWLEKIIAEYFCHQFVSQLVSQSEYLSIKELLRAPWVAFKVGHFYYN